MTYNYTPLPHDILKKGNQTLTVDRVFPTQVIFHFPDGKEVDITREEFDTTARKTFDKGAVLIRNGEEVAVFEAEPEPAPVPRASGSYNLHARLSPSDSKRWTNCTASIAFEEANAHRVVNRDSEWSKEGTEAHDWATKVLMGTIHEDEVPENFHDPVTSYTRHCMSLVPAAMPTGLQSCLDDVDLGFDPPEQAVFVEEQIPLYYQPEQKGTADFIGLTSNKGVVNRLYNRDYKHGMGVLVDTEENTQLAIYAYSVVKHLESAYVFTDDTLIDIAIVQPRHREAGEPNPWVITLADLRTFCEDIEYRAIQARTAADRVREKVVKERGQNVSNDEILEAAPGAVFAPSEGDGGACRWCNCKAFCAVHLAHATLDVHTAEMSAEDMLAAMPELDKQETKLPVEQRISLVSERVETHGRIVTDEYLVNLVGKAKAIRSFLSDAEEYLEARLMAGEEIEGVKLVDGREGNRDWADEVAAETFLKNQGLKEKERFNFVLKSPAKVEALLKEKFKASTRTKNRFEELIVRSPAKKKLAIDADKREAKPAPVAAMPVIEEDDFEV
jgi:hypothetical protein